MSRRVAVTGSSGLLGQAVVTDLVACGYEVVGLDRAPATRDLDGVHAMRWDGRDVPGLAAALSGCFGLVHLAAIPAPFAHPDAQVFTNNTVATFSALEAAVLAGVARIAIASSISGYGMAFAPEEARLRALYVPVDEDHPLRNFDPYGLSKEVDEATARRFCRRYPLSVAALRFHWVADRENQLGSRALRGELSDSSEIRNLWGYVDVRDAARACRLALERAAVRSYGFLACNIVASDVLARRSLADLLAEFAPEVEVRRDVGPTGGGWSIARAEAALGWVPQHSWRDLS